MTRTRPSASPVCDAHLRAHAHLASVRFALPAANTARLQDSDLGRSGPASGDSSLRGAAFEVGTRDSGI